MPTAIFEPALQKIQALHILDLQLAKGLNRTEVAKELGISTDTVARRLALAKKAGLYVQYEDAILQGLVPLAIDSVKTALLDGDAEIGLEILKGVMLLNSKQSTQKSAEAQDDLLTYMNEHRAAMAEEANTHDGTLIGTSDQSGFAKLLAPAPSDHAPTEAQSDQSTDQPEQPTSAGQAQSPETGLTA